MQAPFAALPQEFFARDARVVARNLLGMHLFTQHKGVLTGGIIIETEAYGGVEDQGSHAFQGRRTRRTEAMFAPPGYLYIYLIYGLHHCLNIVTGDREDPQAVLIRSIAPKWGMETMKSRRWTDRKGDKGLVGLVDGPGKLCQALAIDAKDNHRKLGSASVHMTRGHLLPVQALTPRIGLSDRAGAYKCVSWRFVAAQGNLAPVAASVYS